MDSSGQLGNDTARVSQSMPVQVTGLNGAVGVGAGGGFSLAVKSDGTLWSWGKDTSGELGNDAILSNQPTPVPVASLSGMVSVTGGNLHSLAIRRDGTVWSWGSDDFGQLGDDSRFAGQPTPVQVTGFSVVIAGASGSDHSLAVNSDGTLWSWGRNTFGQLGNDATMVNQPIPTQVDLTNIGEIP